MISTPPAGGTRGAAREAAILSAALQLLAEVGYDAMTMDAVAARAHASKATIYRRWSGKADLVIAALEAHAGSQAAMSTPDTGSLRGDLLAVLRAMRDSLMGQDAKLILGLMTAMRDHAELARAARAELIESKRTAFGTVVRRAISRGELPPGADEALYVDVSSAMLFSRMFVTGEPIDDAFITHLVDDVVLPLVPHQARAPQPHRHGHR